MTRHFTSRLSGAMAGALCLGLAGAAGAATPDGAVPSGTWLTEHGDSRVKIDRCGPVYCATITWVKTPGTDRNNPDPALRRRSIVGVELIRDLRAGRDGGWSGTIYNPEDGKTYSVEVKLKDRKSLEVAGCVLGGLLCGSETWSKVAEDSARVERTAAGQ